MDKDNLFVFITISLAIIFLFSLTFVNAVVNMKTDSLANASNHSGTIANITCNTVSITGAEIVNMTFWYNATTHRTAAVTTEMFAYIENTSVAQSVNFTVRDISISGLADSDTYTFWCEAQNDTGILSQNSSYYNITNITIDNTAPTILVFGKSPGEAGYADNATAYKNTADATFNVTIIDSIWLTDGATCTFDVNGTNETVAISKANSTWGYCNSTSLNLTGLSDGVRISNIYMTDSLSNRGINNTYYVWIDTSNPGASASCTPASVVEGSTVQCKCSGTDSVTSVNSSTADSTPSTLAKGTFTFSCTVTDQAGNSASQDTTFLVEDSAGRSTPGGTTTTTTTTVAWTNAFTITSADFEEGYTNDLGEKHRVKFQIESENHHVGVVSLTETQATLEIASDPVQITLSIGEDAKIDVTDNGFYDVYVVLNGIANNKADLTIRQINEEIPEDQGPVQTDGEVAGEDAVDEVVDGEEEAERNLTWLWVLIVVIIVIVIIGGVAKKRMS